MILGVGMDLVDVRRIEKLLHLYGERFWNRVLNPQERALLKENFSSWSALLLAKRFAAKEACSKALGTGISADLSWHDMTIVHGLGKPPQILLSPFFLDKIQKKRGWTDLIKLDLSLSDEYPYVLAFVVLSRN